MTICMIAAVGKNLELGKDNNLIWHFKDDMAFFKETTTGSSIIMGRKTFESLPKVLPRRKNIVITTRQRVQPLFIQSVRRLMKLKATRHLSSAAVTFTGSFCRRLKSFIWPRLKPNVLMRMHISLRLIRLIMKKSFLQAITTAAYIFPTYATQKNNNKQKAA